MNFVVVDKNVFYLFIFILLIFVFFFISNYTNTKTLDNKIKYENSLDKKINELDNQINSLENFKDDSEDDDDDDDNRFKQDKKTFFEKNAKFLNDVDRVYSPIQYPYKSPGFYDQKWYPNLDLPFQVIGAGYRNLPTLGGTEVPIMNYTVPIIVNEDNIAPINIQTRGPPGKATQIGVLYKIYGNENTVYPLFGRQRYPRSNMFDYYTMLGPYGTKVSVITKNNNKEEVSTNDVVFIKGMRDPYRVTLYENDSPSYIPYL